MKIAILRRSPGVSFSMDVYADALIAGLNVVRPNWTITSWYPHNPAQGTRTNSLHKGLQKYYQRYWLYPKQVQRVEADVFHIIDHSDGYLVSALKKTQRPVIVTCHDIVNWIHPEWFQNRAKFSRLSMATWKHSLRGMCQADQVATVSAHTAKDVIEHLDFPAERIRVIPNGVAAAFKPLETDGRLATRREFGIPENCVCLLNVGSNNPRKNVITVLKVLKRLRERGLSVHFCKAGDDFTEGQQTFISEHGLSPYLSYAGKPDQTLLTRLYNATDALVAPSTYEGFGFTVLEAMACKRPVIAANATALPEVVGDAAILVDPLNVTEICDAVRKIYRDPDFAQDLAQAGWERAQQFTWERAAEQFAQAYEAMHAPNPLSQLSDKQASAAKRKQTAV